MRELKFDFLKRPHIEALALHAYRNERIADLFLPIALALMQGGFIGVIADKIFQVHPAVLALISAAPMFGNLSSFFWARVAHGRRKVPLIVTLQTTMVCLVGLIAAVPGRPEWAWLLVSALIASHLVGGGIVTVRSLVWTLNYPRDSRSRVTSRLAVLATLMITVTALAGSWILDNDPNAFRWLYLCGALLAGLGVLAFARVRVVGEQRQLDLERGSIEIDVHAEPGADPGSVRQPPASSSMFAVLRQDPLYARYLSWQFLLGVSNMMVEPVLLYLVSNQLGASYTTSVAITVAIPFGLTVFTVPLWAPFLDRVHVAEFRARHSWFFVASLAFLWLGAVQESLALIAAGRVVLGVARGGGIMAWQLGHNDFADQERVGLYMGVHVTLTGLRGLFAPFLGMLLYVGWSAIDLPGARLPAFEGIGTSLILVSCVLSSVASLGFLALKRDVAAAAARANEG